ncbi:MAG: hypothetical protein KGI58_00020 [Patescibacteria group bacterium]|nr:hypothetical protein [Patescibacteria group bacterium]
MKRFKFYLLSLFTLLYFVVSHYALAANTSTANDTANQITPTSASVVVADVNITDAKIISQKNNIFNITFTITNGKGLQSGVKYGVKLIKDGTSYVADEEVYDKSLTLNENSTVNINITYIAPNELSGDYDMYIASNNESSFPFGIAYLGKVKLVASTKSILISNDSCYLQVQGEKSSNHYTLTQGVDINKNESLILTCTAINGSDSPLSLIPTFETRYFSSYGKVATQTGGDTNAITFTKNEKKTFSLVLPKGDIPQFYNLKFTLKNNDTSSNAVYVNYIIDGVNATIQKLSLDKDYYKSGDKGEMSVLLSASSGQFGRSTIRPSNTPPAIYIQTSIVDNKGNECINPIDHILIRDFKNPITVIPFEIKSSCFNPHVQMTLTDDQGNTLDQKDFTFQSNIVPITKSFNPLMTILIIVSLFIVISIGMYLKSRKNNIPR